ncbi:MAG: NAD(P)H:quinone oxidoreductase [Sphingomonadaceae bacterium]|nr:NAD(P)H:quinone oxidoreductase [Sphingomonadaceae bacterium]
MPKILILYYSSYGHLAEMAEALAKGVRAGGGEPTIRRVPETVSDAVVAAAHFKVNEAHDIASVAELTDYDGFIVGSPTRFGRIAGQMAAFWDGAGKLWLSGALTGRVGAAFTSTATQHGGQETTLFNIITNLLHFGMTIVGLDYGHAGQSGVDEVRGGAPYGATTIADGDGSRRPSADELAGAHYLGEKVARTSAKLLA